jgi:hypothetical protein
MSFLLRTPTTSPTSAPQGHALEEWRRQARLVARLWETYLAVSGESRAAAFSAYMAALDAEEAAANDLAGFSLARVA